MKFLALSKKYASRITALAVAAAVFAAGFSGSAAAEADTEKPKSETVYAVLENDGSYSGATVVNRFFTDDEIIDYGQYTSVTNLMGPDNPSIQGDTVKWPAGLAGENGFYYEGETQKPLPVSFDIAYYLNGEKAQPEDIAGRTGELKIEMTVINNTGTGEIDKLTEREIMTPFAVQVSLSLDSSMYSVREIPDNASSVLAGSSYTLAYSAFPLPESTFSFTLFGTDMSLEPISIIVLPKALPGMDTFGDYIDIDGLTDGTDEMMTGTDDMLDGTNALLDGLKTMKSAAEDMKSGLSDLADGASSLENGTDSLSANAKALKSAADDFYAGMSAFAASFSTFDAGVGELQTSVSAMAENISDLNDAAAQVDSGVGGLGGGIAGLATTNSQLADKAGQLATDNPGITELSGLAAGLAGQQTAIDGLNSSAGDLKTVSAQLSAGLQALNTGFSTDFTASVGELRNGSAALYASCLELLDGAHGIQTACDGLSGGAVKLAGGADDLSDGASLAASQVPELIRVLDELIDGMAQLKNGIGELSTEGLEPLKDGLDGIEGYLDKLSSMAESYTSFMDERNNATVQFIIKTQGL